jgi:mono/diheme cytochrome c family protein
MMATPRHPAPLAGALVSLVLALAACGSDGGTAIELSPAGQAGRDVALRSGCASCHGNDGEGRVGPPFQGLFGSTVSLQDGSTVVADEAYIVESIVDPDAKEVEGYNLPMPVTNLSDDEIAQIVDYIRELGDVGTTEEAAP